MSVVECTGIVAQWCPVHGDCTCRRDEMGEIEWHWEPGYVSFHGLRAWTETARHVSHLDDGCPLHGYRSRHVPVLPENQEVDHVVPEVLPEETR